MMPITNGMKIVAPPKKGTDGVVKDMTTNTTLNQRKPYKVMIKICALT